MDILFHHVRTRRLSLVLDAEIRSSMGNLVFALVDLCDEHRTCSSYVHDDTYTLPG